MSLILLAHIFYVIFSNIDLSVAYFEVTHFCCIIYSFSILILSLDIASSLDSILIICWYKSPHSDHQSVISPQAKGNAVFSRVAFDPIYKLRAPR